MMNVLRNALCLSLALASARADQQRLRALVIDEMSMPGSETESSKAGEAFSPFHSFDCSILNHMCAPPALYNIALSSDGGIATQSSLYTGSCCGCAVTYQECYGPQVANDGTIPPSTAMGMLAGKVSITTNGLGGAQTDLQWWQVSFPGQCKLHQIKAHFQFSPGLDVKTESRLQGAVVHILDNDNGPSVETTAATIDLDNALMYDDTDKVWTWNLKTPVVGRRVRIEQAGTDNNFIIFGEVEVLGYC